MDAGIRACNAAHVSVDIGFVEPLGCGGRAVAGACSAPMRRDSREGGRACKEILTGEEAVLRILGGRGSRTVDWDGAVAAGASVRVILERHATPTVRLCWGCELKELVHGIPGGLCVSRVHELLRGWDTRMSQDGCARICVVEFPKRAHTWGSSTYEVGKRRWGDATRLAREPKGEVHLFAEERQRSSASTEQAPLQSSRSLKCGVDYSEDTNVDIASNSVNGKENVGVQAPKPPWLLPAWTSFSLQYTCTISSQKKIKARGPLLSREAPTKTTPALGASNPVTPSTRTYVARRRFPPSYLSSTFKLIRFIGIL
ncbi:hypothetical protein FIBSPDRAFT_888879 [Athelia psychrophila]|uniref:Uncharacterized protein n=1 Tax=Athelia psychrophila TaxID=1759441 RepID=A0A166MXM9_9AGAM|nr:hypothetical protein FIBSPDRAFT_888879 [Fibularhizoctonia sp. CBS 109695]